MLRRSIVVLAPSIPRSVWDPAHHNTNWTDSYSTSIADRRHWPAKKWSIGLEPRTPQEWLKFSYRNLAYAYNGALRACGTFPEMLVYYKEMKQRGVKVDVDTLNVLLTRAARYEKIHADDVFLLFDELVALGARPDVSAVEILHTVLEHAAHKPFEWREARRRQLVELYQHLALEEIDRLGAHHVDALLASRIARLRGNLKQLKSSLSPSVYRRYITVINAGEVLLQELHHFLWEYVDKDHHAVDVPSLQMRIPFVASVMKRPAPDAAPATVKLTDFEDADVCAVVLAAVERCVDRDFHDARPVTERRMYLALLTMLTSSGVLYTADVIAQLMDIVKYSRDERSRDRDAQRLLRYALRGSSATNDAAYRSLWRAVHPIVDARVVGRYLASRDPWSPLRVCYDQKMQFHAYPALQLTASAAPPPAATAAPLPATAEGENVEGVREDLLQAAGPSSSSAADAEPASSSSSGGAVERTAAALQQRWEDVQELLRKTRVLQLSPSTTQETMEVFTGQMVFLRTIATGGRYGALEDAMSTQSVGDGLAQSASLAGQSGPSTGASKGLYADNLSFDVWAKLLQCVTEVHQSMEHTMAQQQEQHHTALEPEFECWEAMLVTLRCILDFCVVHTQQYGRSAGGGSAEKLFEEAAKLRGQLVEESRTRFNGRLRILWLQEI